MNPGTVSDFWGGGGWNNITIIMCIIKLCKTNAIFCYSTPHHQCPTVLVQRGDCLAYVTCRFDCRNMSPIALTQFS